MDSFNCDHFNDHVRSAYNIDDLLNNKFNREKGTFDGETPNIIIEKLEECFNQEDEDSKKDLLSFIEDHIIDCEARLISAKDYISRLSPEDYQYNWKLDVKNRFISYLINKTNALKIWVNKKSVFSHQSLLDVDGNEQKVIYSKADSNFEKLKNNLYKYNFENLEKVKSKNLYKLIESISDKSIAYQIAFLDFLCFVNKISKDFCNSDRELNTLLAEVLNSTSRTVRGHLNGLKNKNSKDRIRYTAHIHTEEVINHYNKLN